MAGNVWEWVADAYQIDYYAESTEPNPTGGESSNQRVIRGGSWTAEGRALRAAKRDWAFPSATTPTAPAALRTPASSVSAATSAKSKPPRKGAVDRQTRLGI